MVDEGQAVTGVKGPTTTSAVRMHGALWTWLALGVVVALVGTLVLVKVVGGTTQPRTVVALTQTSAARGLGWVPLGEQRWVLSRERPSVPEGASPPGHRAEVRA